jgi:hypothetical protein
VLPDGHRPGVAVELLESLSRLFQVARRDTGQSRRVANFLLAWNNAEENGGWDLVDLWSVDAVLAEDMLRVLELIRVSHSYPADLGFGAEIDAVWRQWRAERPRSQPRQA